VVVVVVLEIVATTQLQMLSAVEMQLFPQMEQLHQTEQMQQMLVTILAWVPEVATEMVAALELQIQREVALVG